jgi:phytoene desaturase (3,4-didehydrolycopene-forming)
LSKKIPELEAHNIFLADEYRESFDNIFKKHLIPDEPSFYVNVPSRVDSSAAPEDKDSVVVLVPVGHLMDSASLGTGTSMKTADSEANANGDLKQALSQQQRGIVPSESQDWPNMIKLARKTILSTIKSRTGADIGPLITTEATNDPSTWKARFNLDKGAILGLSHSFFNVLCFRPTTRARREGKLDGIFGGGILGTIYQVLEDAVRPQSFKHIQGLYMVGASTHPGTGVPICLAGGKLAAEQILEDCGQEVPWAGSVKLQRDQRLDAIERPVWLDSWEQWLILAISLAVLPSLYLLTMAT